MKRCTKCGQVKPLSEFYKNRTKKDGHDSECKICAAKHQRRYRRSEKGQAVRRNYAQSEEGKAARHRFLRSAKGKAIKHRYKQSAKGKATDHSYRLRWPEKCRAGNVITNAIRDDRMSPATAFDCRDCGQPAEQYHHENYSHPLEVIPLCRKCHHARHKK